MRTCSRNKVLYLFTGVVFYAVATCLVLAAAPAAAQAKTPTESLKGTLDQIIKALNDPGFKAPEKKDQRKDFLHMLLTQRVDEEELARRALGSHWKKLSDSEKKEFTDLFVGLLEYTYFEKIDAYVIKINGFSEDNIRYVSERIKGSYAVVETRIVLDKESEFPVYYRLKNINGDWLVSDIAIEGVSLLKNYREQFNDILANSSFQELMSRLKQKQQARMSASGDNATAVKK